MKFIVKVFTGCPTRGYKEYRIIEIDASDIKEASKKVKELNIGRFYQIKPAEFVASRM